MKNLNKFESQAIKNSKVSNNPKSINNKLVLIELLMNNELDREMIKFKGASLYFTKINHEPETQEEYDKKVTSIKNSFDTMVSNFNSPEKVANDKDLNGLTLNKTLNKYSITK